MISTIKLHALKEFILHHAIHRIHFTLVLIFVCSCSKRVGAVSILPDRMLLILPLAQNLGWSLVPNSVTGTVQDKSNSLGWSPVVSAWVWCGFR